MWRGLKSASRPVERAPKNRMHWSRRHFEDFIGDATFKVQCGAVINETTGDVLEEGVDDVSIVLGYRWPYADDD